MKSPTFRSVLLAALALSVTVSAQASTISGLPESQDISSITPYSAGGYYLFATGPGGGRFGVNIGTDISHLPGFVTTFNPPTADEASGFGYASVGTPNGTVTTGTITDGSDADKFSFVLGGTVPANFSVGLLVDNLDATGFNASTLTVTSSGGGSVTLSETAGNQIPDLYSFRISGAASGDTITIGAAQGPNGTATIAGITFTPEPSSFILGGLGLVGLLLATRRRKA